jgi:hypothetical protein
VNSYTTNSFTLSAYGTATRLAKPPVININTEPTLIQAGSELPPFLLHTTSSPPPKLDKLDNPPNPDGRFHGLPTSTGNQAAKERRDQG